MLSQGVLQHCIGAVLPLKDIVQAHGTVEAGQTIGNVVLDIGH
jgi:NADPH:quinone reductase-like Zn-dependent oxidoreductase